MEMPESEEVQPKQPVDVNTVAAFMLEQMAEVAWQKLGLRPDMITGTLETDLNQAKIAIDIVGDLVNRITPSLNEEDRRQVSGLLRDLRLNHVERSKES